MVRRVKWCLSVLLAFAAVAAVSAQADIWSAAGFTGIVDEADLNIHQFNSTGSVSIKSSVSSGALDIRFPVATMLNHQAPAGACTEMRALVRDTGPGVRVIVRLIQLGVRSGFEGQLSTLAQIDSDTTPRLTNLNDPAAYAQYRTCFRSSSGIPFDYSFFNYYVDAQLIKTAAGGNPGPGLMSVQICHTEEQCEP